MKLKHIITAAAFHTAALTGSVRGAEGAAPFPALPDQQPPPPPPRAAQGKATREMSTDRPDATESPHTVEAGRFQIEASLFDHSRDRDGGTETRTWTYGALNLKAGLTDNMDLQIVFDSYAEETIRENGRRVESSGFSDVTARLKVNLWGNDGGGGDGTALGVMPFVKFPTDTPLSNGRWEGGVILPFAADLAEGIGVGLMAEADFEYDPETGGYETEWVHTAVMGVDVTDRLGVFLEYKGVAGGSAGFAYQAALHTGATFAVTEDLQLDAGVRFGLNDAAEDFGVFTGVSVRF